MQADTASVRLTKPISLSARMKQEEKRKLLAQKAEYHYLMSELFGAQQQLQTALNNFGYLSEPKAVDVCIFQMQTAQSQYDNILRRIKALGYQPRDFKDQFSTQTPMFK
ncbi:MAG: DUF2508 family protein [Clostridia bacterium]|nr:DUF2508 family protein [Clostridia bacterium]